MAGIKRSDYNKHGRNLLLLGLLIGFIAALFLVLFLNN